MDKDVVTSVVAAVVLLVLIFLPQWLFRPASLPIEGADTQSLYRHLEVDEDTSEGDAGPRARRVQREH